MRSLTKTINLLNAIKYKSILLSGDVELDFINVYERLVIEEKVIREIDQKTEDYYTVRYTITPSGLEFLKDAIDFEEL